MKQGLLAWRPCHRHSLSPPSNPFLSLQIPRTKHVYSPPIAATLDSTNTQPQQQQQQQQVLTGRERRQLRNERRESKARYNWREEVEERLIQKPKKKPVSSSAELNLDSLARLGPQWYVVRVSRVRSQDTTDLIARSLSRTYPDVEFKIYAPAVQERRKLKNGTYSVKPKPIFPGCVFLWCVLNKEIHDFIREIEGVGGFVGSKVGNKKRQINRPRPVSVDDMEAIFQQAKEEQAKADQAFKEEQQEEGALNSVKLAAIGVTTSVSSSKQNRGSRKISTSLVNGSSRRKDNKLLQRGSTVRVVSGTFAEFVGSLKKVNRKNGKATVIITLFGKESLVELDLHEIVAETN